MGFRITSKLVGFAVSLLVGSLGWSATGTSGDLLRLEKSDEAMGSTFSVVLYGIDRTGLETAADAAFDEVQRLDRMLSNYQPASEWSEVNRIAGFRPVRVSAELFQLLSDCMKYSQQSDGAFDITVGPIMRVWGFYRGEGRLPRPAEVTDALRHVGYRHVLLDTAAQTVQFDHPGVELDPGGIGKGYAVDRMVDVLKGRGVHIALVSASGSSIYGMGAPPTEPNGWRITIRAPGDPHPPPLFELRRGLALAVRYGGPPSQHWLVGSQSDPTLAKADKSAAEVFLTNMSLSTSGSYEKFFWAEGRTYSHIFDPRTGYPAQGTSSVSVLAPRTIDSEAWAKPYFINGRAWTAANKSSNFRVFFCDDARPQACTWIQ